MAWINPRQYLDPIQTNLHSSGRYRTKRACAQIENRRHTSRYTRGLPQMQDTYSLRYHSQVMRTWGEVAHLENLQ